MGRSRVRAGHRLGRGGGQPARTASRRWPSTTAGSRSRRARRRRRAGRPAGDGRLHRRHRRGQPRLEDRPQRRRDRRAGAPTADAAATSRWSGACRWCAARSRPPPSSTASRSTRRRWPTGGSRWSRSTPCTASATTSTSTVKLWDRARAPDRLREPLRGRRGRRRRAEKKAPQGVSRWLAGAFAACACRLRGRRVAGGGRATTARRWTPRAGGRDDGRTRRRRRRSRSRCSSPSRQRRPADAPAAARPGARQWRRLSYDFTPFFEPIAPYWIDGVDVGLCHMETPMGPGPPTTYPIFNTPTRSRRLDRQSSGWDACRTASNHSVDGGQAGIDGTVEALDEAKLAHTGSFSSDGKSREADDPRRSTGSRSASSPTPTPPTASRTAALVGQRVLGRRPAGRGEGDHRGRREAPARPGPTP